jgi:ribosomal protein L29
MKKTKLPETKEDAEKELNTLRKRIMDIAFERISGKVKDVKEEARTRKEIARILTAFKKDNVK